MSTSTHRFCTSRLHLATLWPLHKHHFRGISVSAASRGPSRTTRLPVIDHLQCIFEIFRFIRLTIWHATRKRMSGPRSVLDKSTKATQTVVEYFLSLHLVSSGTTKTVSVKNGSRVCVFCFRGPPFASSCSSACLPVPVPVPLPAFAFASKHRPCLCSCPCRPR